MNAILLVLLVLAAEPNRATDVWPGFRGDGTSTTNARHLPLQWSPTENIAWKSSLPGYGQSSPVVWRERIFLTAIEGLEKEKCLVLAFEASKGKLVWQKEFAASQKGKNGPMSSRAASTPVVDADGLCVLFECGDLFGLSHNGDVRWQRSLVKEHGEIKNGHGLGSSLAQTDKAVLVLVDHQGASYLLAADKKTGKTLWKVDRPSRGSWTSPVVTRQRDKTLVLVSSSGSLTAYDAENGTPLWNLDGLTGNTIPSPTVAGDLVVLGAGENRLKPDAEASARSNCCVRLTLTDGKPSFETAWEGKKVVAHHASPVVHQGCVCILTKTGLVHCLDLATGAERYVERLDNPCWATPIVAGERLYFFGKDGVTTVVKAGPKFERLATNRLWKEEDFLARKEAAKKKPENQTPPRPSTEGTPRAPGEQPGYDAVGDVVYGVAAVDGALYLRTGTELYCVRQAR